MSADKPRASISNLDAKQVGSDINLTLNMRDESVIDEHIDGELEFTSLQQKDRRQ